MRAAYIWHQRVTFSFLR